MACGLTGVVIYRGVANALKTVPANLTVAAFCIDESTHNYSGAYQEFSTGLQQEITESNFQSDNNGFDQQDGFIQQLRAVQ